MQINRFFKLIIFTFVYIPSKSLTKIYNSFKLLNFSSFQRYI